MFRFWYLLIIFGALNRLRGTNGAYAKVIGLLIAYFILATTGNFCASLAGAGYILGEAIYGWGFIIGDITSDGIDDEGRSSEKLIIRGFAWWMPTIFPLWFVGFHPLVLILAIALLSFGFPLACKLGYWSSTKFTFVRDGFSVKGGWEHQEVWYGLMQDIVFVGLWLYLKSLGE